jgi:hypothetical protein
VRKNRKLSKGCLAAMEFVINNLESCIDLLEKNKFNSQALVLDLARLDIIDTLENSK